MNMDNEHWKNYEIQNPDGSWTTVLSLIQEGEETILEVVQKWKSAEIKRLNEIKNELLKREDHNITRLAVIEGRMLALTDLQEVINASHKQ